MKIHHEQLIRSLAVAGLASLSLAGCGNKTQDGQTSSLYSSSAPAPVATTTVGTEIDDGVITTKVKSALLGDPAVKSFEVKVETRKGIVQLSGFVATQPAIDAAVALARGIEGVKGVENSMTLKEGRASVGNTVDDGMITTRVKSALLNDNNVKSFDISVVTRKGEVQLSGYVDSQAQIDRAVEVSQKVEGVNKIVNAMTIKK